MVHKQKVIDLHVDPPKLNFSTDYISALTGCWPLKFLHALDQGLLCAHPGRPHVGLCPIFLVIIIIIIIIIIRPPGTLVPEGLMFYPYCFYFFSPRDLRAPAADRRETLPHDRNLGALYNASPKTGAIPQRNCGLKTCKIWANFIQLQNSIANISGMGQDIQNRKSN